MSDKEKTLEQIISEYETIINYLELQLMLQKENLERLKTQGIYNELHHPNNPNY